MASKLDKTLQLIQEGHTIHCALHMIEKIPNIIEKAKEFCESLFI